MIFIDFHIYISLSAIIKQFKTNTEVFNKEAFFFKVFLFIWALLILVVVLILILSQFSLIRDFSIFNQKPLQKSMKWKYFQMLLKIG